MVVKRWLLHLPQTVNEYEGPARRLAGLLDADLQQGVVVLENKIKILEAYSALEVPPSASPVPAAPTTTPPPSPGGPS